MAFKLKNPHVSQNKNMLKKPKLMIQLMIFINLNLNIK